MQARAYARSLRTPGRLLQLALKRFLDIVLIVASSPIWGPLVLLLMLLIWLDSPGPVIFRQRRLGQYGRVFVMFKLRSMRHGCETILSSDGSTRVFEGDARVTRIGRVMRSTGLDELPQLLNVLKGDMSLVGPRPDQDFHIKHYRPLDYRRLAMRPGITSLGQVSGRNAVSPRRRMVREIQYVRNFSIWLDVKILRRTLRVITQGTGAYNNDFHGEHQLTSD